MDFGLVLGGGGMIGVGWETGLLEGCAEAGVDLTRAKILVGTSAGSIVGAQLCEGGLANAPQRPKASGDGPPGDVFAHLPQEAATEVFATWIKMTGPNATTAKRIGELACQTENDGEALVAVMSARGHEWQPKDLRIVAVSTRSGERRVFDRNSGVAIGRCISASSAVPGMFAPVDIEGARYMDGQVHSGTNADLLAQDAVELVVIVAPTCQVTANRLGAVAEACLRAEVETLEAAGKRVVTVMPMAQDKEAYGSSLMDATHVESAKEAGRKQGRAVAEAELSVLREG